MANVIRIPQLSVLSELQSNISINRNDYSEMMVKISSGQKYLSRSENPVETNSIATISMDISRTDQWAKNIETAGNWEKATQSQIQNVLKNMHRVNELVVQMNSTVNNEGYASIASELNQIIDSLSQNGNARYLGVSMFGGTRTDAAHDPINIHYAVDPVTGLETSMIDSVTYYDGFPVSAAAATRRSIQISETASTQYGTLGVGDYNNSLFQFKSYEKTSSAPETWSYVNVDTFQTLLDIRKSLSAGEKPSDTLLTRAQRALDNVIERNIDNTTSEQKMLILSKSAASTQSAANDRLSAVGSLDVAKAATDLANLQSTLQASLQVGAKLNQISILDYI